MRSIRPGMALFAAMVLGLQICAWAYSPPSHQQMEDTWASTKSDAELETELLRHFLTSQGISNMTDYVSWFSRNMKYLPDTNGDVWSRPLLTLIRGGGDCEDLAFLNVAALKHFGIEARVLGTQKGSDHHVFTVFKHNNRMFVFDNTRLIKTRVSTIPEIAAFLHLKYQVDYVLEVELNPRKITVLFNKKSLYAVTQAVRAQSS